MNKKKELILILQVMRQEIKHITMNENIMNLTKYIDLYKPLAIFLKGSVMLGIDFKESDKDIEIYIDNEEIPLKNYKEKF